MAEKIIAEALHLYAPGIVIDTKDGIVHFDPGGEGLLNNGTPQHLCNDLHLITPMVPAERTFAFLTEVQEAGLVWPVGGVSEQNSIGPTPFFSGVG